MFTRAVPFGPLDVTGGRLHSRMFATWARKIAIYSCMFSTVVCVIAQCVIAQCVIAAS